MYSIGRSSKKQRRYRRLAVDVLIGCLVIGLGFGGWLAYRHFSGSKNSSLATRAAGEAEYVSLSGSYTFAVPDTYVVDDRTVPGMQLVYIGQLTAKTLEEAYTQGAVVIQPLAPMSDTKSDTFKKYINETFVTQLKQDDAEVKVEFAKQGEWDMARVSVVKDGVVIRFASVKNGVHPVMVVGKNDSATLAKLAGTITDVETSDIKDDIGPIRKSLQTIAQLIHDSNGPELYKQASSDLKAKNSEADMVNALKAAETYIKRAITIQGAQYAPEQQELRVTLVFEPANDKTQAVLGVLFMKKTDGQWKVKGLNLPSAQ